MKLCYYSEKQNLGDAINPLIFNKFLPDFFDNNEEEKFLGIGSIIGFPEFHKAEKKIVFSSGFAYGELPKIDDSYDFICVRGPLTAKKLGLDIKTAITDGAILINTFDFGTPEKIYKYSFMPHIGSESFYPWKELARPIL